MENIKTKLRETVWEEADWINLVQNMENWQDLVNMAISPPIS